MIAFSFRSWASFRVVFSPITLHRRDMPKVVRVEELDGAGEILLRAVSDEKTEHMARLVARQRDSEGR